MIPHQARPPTTRAPPAAAHKDTKRKNVFVVVCFPSLRTRRPGSTDGLHIEGWGWSILVITALAINRDH
jgi:hypothetical protein